MKLIKSLIVALALILVVPSTAGAKDKKGQRGMLESMQSVPCGAKERGLTGLGSVFGSVGVQHVDSKEELCAQYLLRTDEMDYHIRPVDKKHAVVLPVGHEAEFKVKKDRLFLKIPDGDRKERTYEVVSMQPVNAESRVESSSYRSVERPADSRPANPPVDSNVNSNNKDNASNQGTNPSAPQPQPAPAPPQPAPASPQPAPEQPPPQP